MRRQGEVIPEDTGIAADMRGRGAPSSLTLSDSVYERLLQQRIIVLGQQVDDDIANRIATFAMGMAASMGQFLLSAGTRGKRYALPHARIMMHQPSSGVGGSESDIVIQAEQSRLLKRELAELIAQHTGQTVEKVTADSERDRWFRAQDALEYGFVDHVITRAGQLPDGNVSSNGNGSTQ